MINTGIDQSRTSMARYKPANVHTALHIRCEIFFMNLINYAHLMC